MKYPSRINPADVDNHCIKVACHFGYTEIVEALMKDDRVNPKVGLFHPIRAAAAQGHWCIFRWMSK
jgi:hypothetical protein